MLAALALQKPYMSPYVNALYADQPAIARIPVDRYIARYKASRRRVDNWGRETGA